MNLTTAERDRLLALSLDSTYLALFTASPTEAGDLTTEDADANYARQPATFTVDSDGNWNLDGPVLFPEPAVEQTVTHFGFADSPAGGTLRWFRAFAEGPIVNRTDQPLGIVDVQVSLA